MKSEKLSIEISNPLLDISTEYTIEFIVNMILYHEHAITAEDKHKLLFEELWNTLEVKLTPGRSSIKYNEVG